MTNPDSLQAICAELRALPFGVFLSGQSNWFASRLERLDAEMRKEVDDTNHMFSMACNADGMRALYAELAELRARLAACERVTDGMVEAALLSDETAVDRWKGKGIPAPEILMREALEAAIAARSTPDPNPSPSSQPYDAEGATVEHDPAKAKAMCTVCGDLVHMDDAEDHCASHRETAPPQ